jgi:hypothetical protein
MSRKKVENGAGTRATLTAWTKKGYAHGGEAAAGRRAVPDPGVATLIRIDAHQVVGLLEALRILNARRELRTLERWLLSSSSTRGIIRCGDIGCRSKLGEVKRGLEELGMFIGGGRNGGEEQ